ncbi:sensor histidine kinase [Listeria ivanovii]|uniref:histidine kinase n=1 Tax=Listeria ivanovii (strain ATCC BAA-678 / PAM 55) TaxID=881621 RepID=G2ZF29_LISIP|nr:HAMP domain-containing sensor histidine kinase [Listeria ivanovii]AHI56850.1 histidine kinase [Listeria ivanovii WSLC3009]AIS66268.1 histidine kinase [Listeria ivanovii subsp. ivanovii]MBC1759937.1 HAMP domain-containing histidine kinase [Listeria ivanovii]MBK3915186.1 HAMP domain-containing histidine kinase [Listeria ivanovii subsp. ivanovii]MBK3922190.1 HAMP domain-containing histidine kinase [Listeria ivanovii subsp. ivanovii]
MKYRLEMLFTKISHVMNIWQATFFAAISWVLGMIAVRTIYLWAISIRDDSLFLKEVTRAIVSLFGPNKYVRVMDSIWVVLINYFIIFLITCLFFSFFYRYMRQKLLKKQLRTINFALHDGKPVDTESFVPEIQELERNIESMRERQNKLMKQEEQAQQARNDLITNVSHDLRTPLTSILGYLSYIHEDRYRDEIELRYYTELVYGKARHLHKLIDDLFSYTRLDSVEYRLKKDELDVIELLSQLVAEYDGQATERNMKIVDHFDAKKLIISGDGNQIMRLFENLFSNALRYGEGDKQIDVSAKQEGNMAVVKVTNYGQEISEIDLPYLFERFYKADKNRTTTGTGLGLAIAKSIVEKHGGIVTAESKNRKTTFIVKLPLI